MSKVVKILLFLFLPGALLGGIIFYFIRSARRERNKDVIKDESGMQLNFDFIKEFETGSLEPTLKVFRNKIDGNLEVGWGHVLPKIGWKEGDTITRAKAEEFFNQDIERAIDVYGSSLNWLDFTDNQRRAIISHAYNTGAKSATIIRLANHFRWQELAAWFPKHYITSGGVEYEGLKRRRSYEASLLLS